MYSGIKTEEDKNRQKIYLNKMTNYAMMRKMVEIIC